MSDKMEHDNVDHAEAVKIEYHVSEHGDSEKHHGIDPNSYMLRTTKLMVALACYIGIGGFILQFDLGYTGNLLVMPPFNKSFGSCAMVDGKELCKLSATQQSMSSSIYLIFMAIGGGLSGLTANYLGPRGAMQFGCGWIIIGASGMLGCAGNLTAFIVCKCIGALGIGHVQGMSTTYGVECAPPRTRGLLITLFATGGGVGNLVVAAVCLGTSTIPNNWSWKTPIILQIPVALAYGCGLFLFPESPRWLLTKGKVDKARQSFAQLYARDPNSPEVTMQLDDTQLTIEEELRISSTANWTEIFHKADIKRTMTAVALNVGGALSGAFFVFSYVAIFFERIGGFKNPITNAVIINGCLLIGLVCGPFMVEYLGRRRTVISGYCLMMTCMIIFSSVSSGVGITKVATRDVLLAFICLWSYAFGAFIASSQWVTSAELHAVRLRTAGQAFVTFVTNIFVFATNFWTPYMLNKSYGNMGTNVGYFYFGLEAIALSILFFVLPAIGKLTLEQIDQFYASARRPWKTSLKRNKRIAKGEIDVKDD